MKRRMIRVLGPALAAVVLLMPAGQATARDDPGPVDWPKIEQPESPGSQSDPAPIKWTTIEQPANQGNASDPKPVSWPAPQPA